MNISLEQRIANLEYMLKNLNVKIGRDKDSADADSKGFTETDFKQSNYISENDSAICDVAELSDVNSSAIDDLAEMVDELSNRVSTLEEGK